MVSKKPAPPAKGESTWRREIVRVGLDEHPLGDLYHGLLNASWTRVFIGIGAGYVLVNLVFGTLYYLAGDGVENVRRGSLEDAFFFSVQTLATIGYGKMVPRSLFANVLVTMEALLGLLMISIGTGLMFAKFSRPNARVLWSKIMVVGPRDGVPCLMLRMANRRQNQIVEATLRMVLARSEVTLEGERVRRLYDLELARASTAVFALTWTAFHPIRPTSPLHGKTREWLDEGAAEIVCSLVGLDDTFGQTVHARHAYIASDVMFGARLVDVLSETADGKRVIDYTRFHDWTPLEGAKRTKPERADAGG